MPTRSEIDMTASEGRYKGWKGKSVGAREVRKPQLKISKPQIQPHVNRSAQRADARPTRSEIIQKTAAGPDRGALACDQGQVGEANVDAPAEVLNLTF